MSSSQTLPPPEGPEYVPCGCGHIEPEHEPNAGECYSCDCMAYVPAAPAAAPSATADRAARAERYGQVLRRWGLLDEVNDPKAAEEFAVTDLLAIADAEQAELRRERDLAIAHDRQPYPTAWAYEQACKALRRKTEAIERVRSVLESEAVVGRSALDYRGLITSALMADEAQQPEPHVYLSTGCLHNEHAYCQSNTGANGAKQPAQCKFCTAPCICACHTVAVSQPGKEAGL
ncbi:hypothetical protein AB0D78_28400 [Streptomyces avermitilis]|uniref:hypothetical protein n=1 Tax=Streptomyces avermitilis TaxID=33903 RepID=UPI0033D4C251